MRLKCNKCGNNISFYREVSVIAKLKVNNKGKDLKTIYDIDKSNIDGYYEPIYCGICNEVVKETDVN